MPALKVELDGDGKFPQLQGKKIHSAEIECVTALPRGMQSGRSASAVGVAPTSAVVTAIVFIIVTDAISAVVTNIIGMWKPS